MEAHRDLDDLSFLRKLEDCSLDPTCFSHEAHLRLAWLKLQNSTVEQAISEIRTLLQNYVAHLCAQDKYHETLTVAAVRIVYHFHLKSKAETFDTFIETFPRLKTNFKDLITQHYEFDLFSSEEAKKIYFEPGLLGFD